jgi:hypothetical protein
MKTRSQLERAYKLAAIASQPISIFFIQGLRQLETLNPIGAMSFKVVTLHLAIDFIRTSPGGPPPSTPKVLLPVYEGAVDCRMTTNLCMTPHSPPI